MIRRLNPWIMAGVVMSVGLWTGSMALAADGGELNPVAREAVVDGLVEQGLSHEEAEAIATQAERDVTRSDHPEMDGRDMPELTGEEQAFVQEMDTYAKGLQEQGLSDAEIREQCEARFGNELREMAERHGGWKEGEPGRETMEPHREEMERMHREWEQADPAERERMQQEMQEKMGDMPDGGEMPH